MLWLVSPMVTVNEKNQCCSLYHKHNKETLSAFDFFPSPWITIFHEIITSFLKRYKRSRAGCYLTRVIKLRCPERPLRTVPNLEYSALFYSNLGVQILNPTVKHVKTTTKIIIE